MKPPADSAWNGLWHKNAALVQMVGLCPLLAVTTSVVNGFSLGLATLFVLLTSNLLISALRPLLFHALRIPFFVLIIASMVTCIDLLSSAFLFEIHETLGLFIPLIITNCTILAQAETVASRSGLVHSVVAALATGLGFMGVLVTLGAMREAIGSGTLFAGFESLVGPAGSMIRIDLPTDGMLVAVLPPGAFFGLAVLLAVRNACSRRPVSASENSIPQPPTP